jgi:HAMP domain-containing protein
MASGPTNPIESFQEMVNQWERSFDAFSNQVMGTEAYSQAMNEMQKVRLNAQRMFSEAMTQQLTAMNMPTRDDIVNLAQAIQRLDQRLERIEDKLEIDDKPHRAGRNRPPRTKKPDGQQDAPGQGVGPGVAQ